MMSAAVGKHSTHASLVPVIGGGRLTLRQHKPDDRQHPEMPGHGGLTGRDLGDDRADISLALRPGPA